MQHLTPGTNRPGKSVAAPPDFEISELKEIWELPSLEEQFLQVQSVFEDAGYSIRTAELSPHDMPIAYLRMRRKAAPRFAEGRELRQHIKQILQKAPLFLRETEVNARHDGESVLVSFQWDRPEPIYADTELKDEFVPP